MKIIARQTITPYCLVAAAVLLSGCTQWPREGQGGMAEHTSAPFHPIEINTADTWPLADDSSYLYFPTAEHKTVNVWATNEQVLRLESHITEQTLATLILQGARVCLPATVHTLQLRQNRITRELVGGLSHDAALNIQQQQHQLALLRQQMHRLNPQASANGAICRPPLLGLRQQEATAKAHALQQKTLLDLLNSDNQFAVNSAAINPKYAKRLARAAHLLNKGEAENVLIIGHTDTTGTPHTNRLLAEERASAVANFLIAHGINPERISTEAQGANAPYSPQAGVEHWLVNRRVEVRLMNHQNAAITLSTQEQ